jgi:hypothetical protein
MSPERGGRSRRQQAARDHGLACAITATPFSTQHPATATIVLQTAGGRTFDLHAVIVTPTTTPAAP